MAFAGLAAASVTAGGGLLGGGIQGLYNAKAAKKQYQRAKKFYQHRHQWEVDDLRSAGLNPILSAKYGGGGVPSIASAQGLNLGNPLGDAASAYQSAASGSTGRAQQKQQTKQSQQQTRLQRQQEALAGMQQDLVRAQTAKTLSDGAISAAQARKATLSADAYESLPMWWRKTAEVVGDLGSAAGAAVGGLLGGRAGRGMLGGAGRGRSRRTQQRSPTAKELQNRQNRRQFDTWDSKRGRWNSNSMEIID